MVADTVGARAEEVVFTSSGVHAATAAIAGLAKGRRRIGPRIVASAVDHSSVLAAAETYGEPVIVGVDHVARVDLETWSNAVRSEGVAAASLQVANHEVGTLQPYAEAAEAFGGPPSVGLMVIRRGVRWRAPYPTDDYQAGRWPGAPDIPAIAAAAAALEVWRSDRETVGARQHALVEELRSGIASAVPDVDVAGDPNQRVPHLLTFSALYVDGEALTLELDKAGFAVSSGSACSASNEHPSHVLAAMGALTHGNVRIGVTRTTTDADIDRFLEVLPPIIAQLRATVSVR